MNRTRFGCVCALLIAAALASTARATPIPVTIEGFIEANVYRFNVEGDDFVYRVSAAEGPLVVAVCPGLPCAVEQRYSGGDPSVQFGEHASWKGITASEATGSILLAFLLNAVPPRVDQDRFTANVPISMSGGIVARSASPDLDERFRFTFKGKGPGTVSGRSFTNETVVQGAQFTTPGTAEPVPEPATLLLVGSAIAAVTIRRRARAA